MGWDPEIILGSETALQFLKRNGQINSPQLTQGLSSHTHNVSEQNYPMCHELWPGVILSDSHGWMVKEFRTAWYWVQFHCLANSANIFCYSKPLVPHKPWLDSKSVDSHCYCVSVCISVWYPIQKSPGICSIVRIADSYVWAAVCGSNSPFYPPTFTEPERILVTQHFFL